MMQSAWNFMTNLVFALGANGGLDTVDLNAAQELLAKEINKIHEIHNKKHKIKLEYEPRTKSGIDQRLIDLSLGGKIEINRLDQLINNIKSGETGKYSLADAQQLMQGEINRIARYHDIEITQEQWNILNSNLVEISSDNQVEISKLNKFIDSKSSIFVFICQNQLKKLPIHIRNLENIYYFKTNWQSDNFSCGFWTCFNAQTMTQLINELAQDEDSDVVLFNLARFNKISLKAVKSINPKTLKNEKFNKKYEPIKNLFSRQEYLADTEIESIALCLGLNTFNLQNQNISNLHKIYKRRLHQNNLFLIKLNGSNDINDITVNQKTIMPNHLDAILNRVLTLQPVQFTSDPKDPKGEDFGIEDRPQEKAYQKAVEETWAAIPQLTRKFFKKLKQNLDLHVNNNTPTVINFACQTDAPHWILISILKLPDRKPIMTLCDSLNWKIRTHIEYQEYIMILHKIFIQPYIDIDTQNEAPKGLKAVVSPRHSSKPHKL